MKVKSRILCVVACLLVGCMILSGCGDGENDKKISIVATIFPEYDWVKQIIGNDSDNIELTLLLDKGVDLHNYQPTAEDIIKVSACDMFIYVGGHSDSWVHDVLSQAKNEKMVVINLMDVLGDSVKEEELVEGMEHEHGGEESEHKHEHEKDEHEKEYDEHVWLSLKNAKVICERIGDELVKLDSKNKDKYEKNLWGYCDKLESMHQQYQNIVSEATVRTLLFADRFPFRYLVDDYDLSYYAAFAGCSAESEASFETITFLAGKVDELGLSKVVVLEGNERGIADTVISASAHKNIEVVAMNSMQTVTYDDVKNGASYLLIMEENLEALKNALK